MEKQDIQTRADIELVVSTFYSSIRKHATLGPIFNSIVQDWEEHESRISDFWETNLFFRKKYKGNPMKVHLTVDNVHQNTLTQAHFGNWLALWHKHLDQLFAGKNVELAKNRARNMAHIMFMRIFEARKKTTSN